MARNGIVVAFQVKRVGIEFVPTLDILVAKDNGQRQVVEFLGGHEVHREWQPFVLHIQLLAIDLTADVACREGESPVGIGPIGGGHIHAQSASAPGFVLHSCIFQVGANTPFVGQLTPPAQGDGIVRNIEGIAIGGTALGGILHFSVVVILHRGSKTTQVLEGVTILRRGEIGTHFEIADIRQCHLVVHLRRDGRRVEHSRLKVAIMHWQRDTAQSHHTGRVGVRQSTIKAVGHLRIGLQGDKSQQQSPYSVKLSFHIFTFLG